ncbi:MAG: hypothetical protein J2P25_22090, partial [Nocardiopsaceae bacterium]|nr:hypothetical protein [Nocardiopsaceae bacterium]
RREPGSRCRSSSPRQSGPRQSGSYRFGPRRLGAARAAFMAISPRGFAARHSPAPHGSRAAGRGLGSG